MCIRDRSVSFQVYAGKLELNSTFLNLSTPMLLKANHTKNATADLAQHAEWSLPVVPEAGVRKHTANCDWDMQLSITSRVQWIPIEEQPESPGWASELVHGNKHLEGGCNSTCGLGVHLTLNSIDMQLIHADVHAYVVVAVLCAVLQIYVLLEQTKFSNTQVRQAKIAPATMGAIAVHSCYDCLAHLGASLVVSDELFRALAMLWFLKFVVFLVLEMRLGLAVVKARHPEMFGASVREVRLQVCSMYMKFYAVIILGMMLVSHLRWLAQVVPLVLGCFWLPQLHDQIRTGTTNAILPGYIWGTTIAKLLPLLYVLGMPHPAFVIDEAEYLLSGLLIGLAVVQAAPLHVLSRGGLPRWMIPARFLPARHDYFDVRPFPESERCAICMSGMEVVETVQTPCDHLFHTDCLAQWLDIKTDCPVCRCTVPELEPTDRSL
eukprot:TRINITY_DN9773_c0_g1_i8.p1 TRINITY_DN9773_c0_g1~~TRINITY_DN9773_c0_g1_i8.p1  ORF type:complete len:435 (+),score=72.41 TRINITY_DN9773_c0_g1_i8:97-1401(+)